MQATLMPSLLLLAQQAGDAVMAVYGSVFEVGGKADRSPVTAADEQAEAIIVAGLQQLTPGVPVVAEEAVSRGQVPATAAQFWLVDPLDGTREFVQRNGEFTVNIALVQDAVPVLGVVLAPALGRLFGGVLGAGAFEQVGGQRRPIGCRAPPEALTVLCSRSHDDRAALEAFVQGRAVARWQPAGSSLKFALIAAGEGDLYPRLSRTMEWDTAAGDAVLRAAGGITEDLQGQPLRYGKPEFENPHFVARAGG